MKFDGKVEKCTENLTFYCNEYFHEAWAKKIAQKINEVSQFCVHETQPIEMKSFFAKHKGKNKLEANAPLYLSESTLKELEEWMYIPDGKNQRVLFIGPEPIPPYIKPVQRILDHWYKLQQQHINPKNLIELKNTLDSLCTKDNYSHNLEVVYGAGTQEMTTRYYKHTETNSLHLPQYVFTPKSLGLEDKDLSLVYQNAETYQIQGPYAWEKVIGFILFMNFHFMRPH